MDISIRKEEENDYKITEQLVEAAFASAQLSDQDEHHLVSRIRKSDAFIPDLSLVAVNEVKNERWGHILLSKIFIDCDNGQNIESLALAPVSVLPDKQNKGIGKALINTALKKARELGFKSVIVLGYPDYYVKFGFKQSSIWNIRAPFEVPEEALMAVELQKGALEYAAGVIQYPSAFFS